jgi:hypothetical protein
LAAQVAVECLSRRVDIGTVYLDSQAPAGPGEIDIELPFIGWDQELASRFGQSRSPGQLEEQGLRITFGRRSSRRTSSKQCPESSRPWRER